MSSSIPPGGTGRSVPPSKTPAARRLRRFTSDPRYSTKLRQLPRGEQRRILDLVTANQGKQARQEVLTSYQTRREARNAQARQRRLDKSINEALHNVGRQLPEARLNRMKDHFQHMTWQDRRFAKTATRDELRDRARSDYRIVVDGKEINPFWYG